MFQSEIYQSGNRWQKNVYQHMTDYLESKGVGLANLFRTLS